MPIVIPSPYQKGKFVDRMYRIDNQDYIDKLSELTRLQSAHASCSNMDLSTMIKHEYKINPKAG